MNASRRRFTLIELLVVVAVVSLLATLLLPALATARSAVKRAACASNMRNLHQGCMMYVNDWNGWLPPAAMNVEPVFYCNEYLRQASGFIASTTSHALLFERPVGIYFCPAVSQPPQSAPAWQESPGASASYYYSCYQATRTNNASNPKSGCWVNALSIGQPRLFQNVKDGCVLIGDQNFSRITGVVYKSSNSYGSATGNLVSEWAAWNHFASANFLFKDGRVEARKFAGVQLFDDDFTPLR